MRTARQVQDSFSTRTFDSARHGAAPTTAMTQIALQETANGKNVEWLEKVSDEQYKK
jgi:hypothetical protein